MNQQIELIKYPIVIEPVVRVLEVFLRARPTAAFEGDTAEPFWTRFYRLGNSWEFPWPTDNSVPHLFGNSSQQDRCKLVLGYGSSGCIQTIYYLREKEWIREVIPEEATGIIPPLPSLRLVFHSEQELEEFFGILADLSVPDPTARVLSIRHQALIRLALKQARHISVAGTISHPPIRST